MSRPLLLDTHALLWWMMDDPHLPPGLKTRIADSRQEVYVSAASVWEIAIKARRGRLNGVEEYLAEHVELHREWGFHPVAIDTGDAQQAGGLPFDHADPFDRMLIVHSLRFGALLATCDSTIHELHEDVYWA